ncbi:TetR/AcrR family transcriptional regulator [Microbacterium sp. NPDC077184]|uniref:TetR/AcrR family transcriptional regulator n=1 Tax=Microbacterium sp. NPDC077184 TaxID=3154764 RepID=UPI00341D1479
MPDSAEEAILTPPTLTPRAQRILDVASELFYRRGLHAVGVDTISAESGVTKRTLYDRFGSKDAVIEAYLQQRHTVWWARMERRIAAQPDARVLALWDAHIQDAEPFDRGCAFLNAGGELPVDHPALRVIRAHKAAVRDRFVDLVTADHPDIADPDRTAEVIVLLLEGGMAHRGIDGDDHLLRRGRDEVERILSAAPA